MNTELIGTAMGTLLHSPPMLSIIRSAPETFDHTYKMTLTTNSPVINSKPLCWNCTMQKTPRVGVMPVKVNPAQPMIRFVQDARTIVAQPFA